MEILRDENLLESSVSSPTKLKKNDDNSSNEANSRKPSFLVQESESGTDGYESPDDGTEKESINDQGDVDLLGMNMKTPKCEYQLLG